MSLLNQLLGIVSGLADEVDQLEFGAPVTHVYNPLRYAWEAHRQYLQKWGLKPRRVVLLGMNPGPFGMAQTGIPFGEVTLVRDWIGIRCGVRKPRLEHPRRPIEGFSCRRSEVSGARLWGWARDRFRTPEAFFSDFFVYNYCPLSFVEESGRNRTPDKLPVSERRVLFQICDTALARLVALMEPRAVLGVGAFAEERIRASVESADIQLGRILHPSPASPRANRGWAATVEEELGRLGIRLPEIDPRRLKG